jgi:hypothetical protein
MKDRGNTACLLKREKKQRSYWQLLLPFTAVVDEMIAGLHPPLSDGPQHKWFVRTLLRL